MAEEKARSENPFSSRSIKHDDEAENDADQQARQRTALSSAGNDRANRSAKRHEKNPQQINGKDGESFSVVRFVAVRG